MSPEFWTAFASMGTLIVIAATAVAAIIQLHHLRGSNQIIALNEFRESFESSELAHARDAVFELDEKLKDPAFRRSLEDARPPESLGPVHYVGRLMELLGSYVKHGIVSKDIVLDLWAIVITTFWTRIAPTIVVMRRTTGPALYENFEMLACLAQRWLAKNAATYPKNLPRTAPPDRWAEEDAQSRAVK